jgi:PadR family transcriptional regulator
MVAHRAARRQTGEADGRWGLHGPCPPAPAGLYLAPLGMTRNPMPSGQIDLLLLSIIAQRPAHGYAMIKELRLLSNGAFDLPEGSIYPALYRLEGQGLVSSREEQVDGRRRRIYRLTRSGRAACRDRSEEWREHVRNVESVLRDGLRHA